MTLTYIGSRSKCHYRSRGGEFLFDERDQDKVDAVIDELKDAGWEITTGIPEWAFCKVYDKIEFDELMRDFRAAKKHQHLR